MEKLRPREGAQSSYNAPTVVPLGVGAGREPWPGSLGYGPGRLQAGGILLSSPSQLLADLSLHHCQIPRFKFKCLCLNSTSAQEVSLGMCHPQPLPASPPPVLRVSCLIGLPCPQGKTLVCWKEFKVPFVICVNKLPGLCEPQFAFLQNGVEIQTPRRIPLILPEASMLTSV